MDITGIARQGVNTAFGVANQAVKPIVLRINPNAQANYNPTTGAFDTGSSPEYAVSALVYNALVKKAGEDAAKVLTFIIRVEELAAVGFVGRITDADIIVHEGNSLEIASATIDPVDVIWTVEIRR